MTTINFILNVGLPVENGDVISKEYIFKYMWGICYIKNIQYKK